MGDEIPNQRGKYLGDRSLKISSMKREKTIFIIGAHCENLRDEHMLISLVEKIKGKNYDYILCSHSKVPSVTYLNSRYFSYDSKNSKNLNSLGSLWFTSGNFKLHSPFLNGSILGHADAALDLLLNGIAAAQRLGYEVAHWIEYDSSVSDFEGIIENEKEIFSGECDGVFYETGSRIYPIGGNFFTFSLNEIDPKEVFISYEDKKERMEKCNYSSEFYIKNHLMGSLRKKIKEMSSNFPKNQSTQNSIRNWVVFEEPEDGTLKLFMNNQTSSDWELQIYTDKYTRSYTVSSYQWQIDPLFGINKFSIRTSVNEILDFDFSDPDVYQKLVRVNRMEYCQ